MHIRIPDDARDLIALLVALDAMKLDGDARTDAFEAMWKFRQDVVRNQRSAKRSRSNRNLLVEIAVDRLLEKRFKSNRAAARWVLSEERRAENVRRRVTRQDFAALSRERKLGAFESAQRAPHPPDPSRMDSMETMISRELVRRKIQQLS